MPAMLKLRMRTRSKSRQRTTGQVLRQFVKTVPFPEEVICRAKIRSASRWRVLLAVMFTADQSDESFVYQDDPQLIRMTGLDRRTVQAALRDLVDAGLLIQSTEDERPCVTLLTEAIRR